MGYTRMFTASCDKCGEDYDEGFWWKGMLQQALRKDGWHAGSTVVCPDCKEAEK